MEHSTQKKTHPSAHEDFLANREERYQSIIEEYTKFFGKYNQTTHKMLPITKMAALNTLIRNKFPDFIFVGFYVVVDSPLIAKPETEKVLELGPYQSEILATPRISFGRGVCGTCWEKKTTQIINSVKTCDNYIPCDDDTQSEIVIPIFKSRSEREVQAVWDIDSIVLNRFVDDVDKKYLEKIAEFMYD